jgi:hypothetical protein
MNLEYLTFPKDKRKVNELKEMLEALPEGTIFGLGPANIRSVKFVAGGGLRIDKHDPYPGKFLDVNIPEEATYSRVEFNRRVVEFTYQGTRYIIHG